MWKPALTESRYRSRRVGRLKFFHLRTDPNGRADTKGFMKRPDRLNRSSILPV